jgi:hypothetical protein
MKFLSMLLFSQSFEQLNTSVWLSGAAYCGKDKLGGPAFGFIFKDIFYDIKTDLQGYIGIIPEKKYICCYKMNWLDDFEVKKQYSTYDIIVTEHSNMVHHVVNYLQ